MNNEVHLMDSLQSIVFSPVAFDACGFLIGCALKSLVIVAVALTVAGALRKHSAAARHLVWLLAMVCLLMLPLLALCRPRLPQQVVNPLTVRSSVPAWAPATMAFPNQEAPLTYREISITGPSRTTPSISVRPSGASAQSRLVSHKALQINPSPSPSIQGSTEPIPVWPAVFWLAALWLPGVALLLGRLAACLILAVRLTGNCMPLADGLLWNIAQVARRRIGYKGRLRLAMGDWNGTPAVPMTIGVFCPTVLLPAEAIDWPQDRIEVSILHEVAHIRRRDWAWQVLASAACAVFWFNPLVWFAASRLRAESEAACDDLVLLSGAPAADYAGHLLEIARVLSRRRPSVPTAVAAVSRPQIEVRLKAILDRARRRRPLNTRARAICLLLASLILLPVGLMKWESRASAHVAPQVARLALGFANTPKLAFEKALNPLAQHDRRAQPILVLNQKGNSTMPVTHALVLNPKIGKTVAALASFALMASPNVALAQSAQAIPPTAPPSPAVSLPDSNPPSAPNTPAAPVAMPVPAPDPSKSSPASPAAPVAQPAPASSPFGTMMPGTMAALPQSSAKDPTEPSGQSLPAPAAPGALQWNFATPGYYPPAGMGAMPGGVTIDGTHYFDVTPQTDAQGHQVFSIDTGPEGEPINILLGVLCQAAGVSYTVSPDVHGTVSVYLKSVSLEAALRAILEASDPPLTYSVAVGVYHFRAKADPGSGDAALPQTKVSLDLDTASLNDAIKQLFDTAHASYTMDSAGATTVAFGTAHFTESQSAVTLHLHNVSFGAALHALLNTTSPALTYSVKDGIVYIKPADTTVTWQDLGQAASPYEIVQPDDPGQATPSYKVEQPYVYKPEDWKPLAIQHGEQSAPSTPAQ